MKHNFKKLLFCLCQYVDQRGEERPFDPARTAIHQWQKNNYWYFFRKRKENKIVLSERSMNVTHVTADITSAYHGDRQERVS